jgi:hypothetical protein
MSAVMRTVVPLQVPHRACLAQLVGDDVQVGSQLPAASTASEAAALMMMISCLTHYMDT